MVGRPLDTVHRLREAAAQHGVVKESQARVHPGARPCVQNRTEPESVDVTPTAELLAAMRAPPAKQQPLPQ